MTQAKGSGIPSRRHRAIDLALALPSWVAGATLFFLMTMTFVDVVLRSILNSPMESATELTRIAVVVIVFTSLPMVSARGENIAVDLLDSRFGPLAARLRDGLSELVCGALLYWPITRIWVLAERARRYGDVTEYLNIPQFYVAYFVLAMTTITAILLVVKGLMILAGYRPQAERHEVLDI
ncbi:MAG: TRAP transporter small permease [Nitratireductor sp.]|nr:TRAP transporter small permease [Nitratireductor sp.]